jgi:hypothetical protein
MNNLDKFFNQQLNTETIKYTPNQKSSIENNIEFIKGSDYCRGYYNENILETKYVRYYQIAMFNSYSKKVIESGIALVPPKPKRCVRSYLLKGQSTKGACFFDWHIIEIKNYKIAEKELNTFIEYLNSNKKKSNFTLQHKFYPVYNFDDTAPPTGEEINQCVSELLYNS